MNSNCQLVVFTNKAYNAIIRESFDKDPVETGGILLGHVLDNGVWIVMEVLPPGINCVFQYAYFEYDDEFVNYLAQSVAHQYKIPLELLGLWHRHPGSMDVFSTTDDGTNMSFAKQNSKGVISALVNIDPEFRMTMYHAEYNETIVQGRRPAYSRVEVEVGNDIIPEGYFKLKYYDNEADNLHPRVQKERTYTGRTVNSQQGSLSDSRNTNQSDYRSMPPNRSNNNDYNDLQTSLELVKKYKKWLFVFFLLLLLLFTTNQVRKHDLMPKFNIEWCRDSSKVQEQETKIKKHKPERKDWRDKLRQKEFEDSTNHEESNGGTDVLEQEESVNVEDESTTPIDSTSVTQA